MSFINDRLKVNGIVPDSVYLSLKDGMDKMKKGSFAFHMDRPRAYNFLRSFDQTEICQLKEISFQKDRYLGIVVAKKCTFRERTSVSIAWMKETGVLNRIVRIWEWPKPICVSKSQIYRSVSISDVGSISLMLIIVNMISSIILIFEKIYFNHERLKVQHKFNCRRNHRSGNASV